MRSILTRALRPTSQLPRITKRVVGRGLRNRSRLVACTVVLSLLLSTTLSAPRSVARGAQQSAATSVWLQASRASLELRHRLETTYSTFGAWMASRFIKSENKVSPMSEAPPVVEYLSPQPLILNAPTNLAVTGTTSNQVCLSWTASSGTVDHYQVERSQSMSGPFLFVSNSAATTFNDNTVSISQAFLYRVRAVDSGGLPSSPSNIALGTAVSFEFTLLQNKIIRAQHLYDIRTAVNAVRTVAGLSAATWTRSTVAGLTIQANDVQEIRTKLGEALSILNISVGAYVDPSLTSPPVLIQAIHFEQLQTRSTRGSSSSSGPIDSDSTNARLDPLNETGGGAENPLSRNFNWNLPLVGLPGRAGMDLGLTLSYNSLVWTRSGNNISFNDDHGYPAPGFRLGFPVIQSFYYNSEVGQNAYLLIGPDGSRTELRQVATQSPLYESGDSSHLLFDTSTMILRTTDGTQLSYTNNGLEFVCNQIKDRNGNYLTINYTALGQIDTIIDTLSRTLQFTYVNGQLTKISQIWKQGSPNQVTHDWAAFTYSNTPIQTNFSDTPALTVYGPPNGSTITTLQKVTLADGSHFDFLYSSWGQIYKISSYATDNHLLNYRSYNLPQTAATAYNDCPRFTERHDWAQYWNGDTDGTEATNEEAVTTFAIPASDSWTMPDGTAASGVRAQVTAPDNTSDKIYFVGTAGTTGWKRGLSALVNTYDASAVLQRQSMTTWEQDDETKSYILNPRVKETNIYDPSGNRKRTKVTYQPFALPNSLSCKLPQDVFEYDTNATTVLRSWRTDYNMTTPYASRRILGLASEKRLYEGDVTNGGTLMSRVGFNYDGASSLQGNDAPIRHDNTAFTSSFYDGRGNVSSIQRYDVTNGQYTTSTMIYNTAGAVVVSKDALLNQVTISYADSFSDNNNSRNTLAYPTTVTDPDNYSSTSKYDFDFGSVTYRRTPQPNTTQNLPGPEQTVTYDVLGRLQQTTNLVNNAYTRYEYPPNQSRVDTYATIQEGEGEAHSFKITDGAGRVIASAVDHPGSLGGFSGQRFVYNNLGQVIQTSNPTETSATGTPFQWSATGDDQTAGWIYTQQTYDWKGRPLVTTNPSITGNPAETTTKELSYSGCGCAGGEVVTVTDEGTVVSASLKKRQQKVYHDMLGRVIKTETLNWDGPGPNGTGGSVYSTTVNTYNARDQITLSRQFEGTSASTNFQDTTISYDGFGRIKTKHEPEQAVDPSNPNSTDHTTWTYNADDTLDTIKDARGATTTYGYVGTNRRLVTSIAHSMLGSSNINISYDYDAVGNRLHMTDAYGTTVYDYNSFSRLSSETRTFTNVGTYQLSYQYNLAGQLKKMTYPNNMSIEYGHDKIGRLNGVTGADVLYNGVTQYASDLVYRAFGALKQMKDGANRTAVYDYNQRLQVKGFGISSVVTQTYDYNNDGTPRFVNNVSDTNFDRSYSYDHVGRILFAGSGGAAREQVGTTPYWETFSHDAFGNTTYRFTESWSQDEFVDSGTYHNGRRDEWAYDADGRIKTVDTRQYTYDASGENTLVSGQVWAENHYWPTSTASGYDGNGQKVEEISSGVLTLTTKYLRSTVLGGAIVQEINSAGQTIGYVYTPEGALLTTLSGFPKWKHQLPGGVGLYETYQDGFVHRVEFDPMGADVGVTAPTPPDTNGGDGDIGANHNGGNMDSRFGDMSNPAAGCFSVDGVTLPCTWSEFDVLDMFVWRPLKQPPMSTNPGDDSPRGKFVRKPTFPINIENPFDKFLDIDVIRTDTNDVAPAHWEEMTVVNFLNPQNFKSPTNGKIESNYWKKWGKSLYNCIDGGTVFGADSKRARKWLDSHGLPDFNLTNSSTNLQTLFKMKDPPRAVPEPNQGPNGTIYVAAEYAPPNKPLAWVFESITHETGNIIAYNLASASWGLAIKKYGDPNGISNKPGKKPGEGDTDAGAKLEKCVHKKVRY